MIQIAQNIPEPCPVWHGWQGSDGVESAFEMKFEVPESATAAWPGDPGTQIVGIRGASQARPGSIL